MPTETIHIEAQDAAMIRDYVAQGRFHSVSEVISAGLHLLEAKDRENGAKLEALRQAAQKGIDDLEAGRYTEVNGEGAMDTYRASIRERGMARLKESGVDVEALKTQ